MFWFPILAQMKEQEYRREMRQKIKEFKESKEYMDHQRMLQHLPKSPTLSDEFLMVILGVEVNKPFKFDGQEAKIIWAYPTIEREPRLIPLFEDIQKCYYLQDLKGEIIGDGRIGQLVNTTIEVIED